MTHGPSIWSFIAHADIIVKIVISILLLASLFSWAIILQRHQLFKHATQQIKKFEQFFWSGTNLSALDSQMSEKAEPQSGMALIFRAGYGEYRRLNKNSAIQPEAVLTGTQRAMRIAEAQEQDKLQHHLGFLATVGSTSPFIGLLGTVWGVMSAFRALGAVQQATISMVAPGISEALIATAIGLLAAIPAVIGYNRLSTQSERLMQRYENFSDQLTNIIHRQLHQTEK